MEKLINQLNIKSTNGNLNKRNNSNNQFKLFKNF